MAAGGVPQKLVLWTPVDDALLKSSIEGGMSLSDIATHIVRLNPKSYTVVSLWRLLHLCCT